MRIGIGRRSGQLSDRRGAGGMTGMGGGIPLPLGMLGGLGLPGVLILLALLILPQLCSSSGPAVNSPFDQFPNAAPRAGGGIPADADPDAELVNFVSFVLDDVQFFWADEFKQAGENYRPAELVLFTNATSSGCGAASSAVGPFYCGADQTVYLDLDFFRELRSRFGAPGDFAQAYVIAHEIGHHVQEQLGISADVRDEVSRHPDEANELSMKQELQADCLAGVWGFSTSQRGILEAGDLEEALTAASAIGDDRIQEQTSGQVNRETWTHGSSEQRVTWFRRGFDSGDIANCDTFNDL